MTRPLFPFILCTRLVLSAASKIDSETMSKMVEEVKSRTSVEEYRIMATLLEEHAHPRAVPLLHDVIKRPRRMQSIDCWNFSTEAECNACTGHCVWDGQYGGCMSPNCFQYSNESTCCANANGVTEGCYWDAHHVPWSGETVTPTCVSMHCSSLSDTACSSVSGCVSTCAGCKEAGTTCQCQEGGSNSCSSGTGGLNNALVDLMSCPLMQCSVCLKGSSAGSLTLAQMQAKRTSECSGQCDSVVHCDAEVTCLLDGSGSSDSTSTSDACSTPPTIASSCVSSVPTPAPDSSSSMSTCAATCTAFDTSCAASCGAGADCSSVSGAFSNMLACSTVVLTVAVQLALLFGS